MGFFSNLNAEIHNAVTIEELTEMLKKYNIEEGCDLYAQCVLQWTKDKEADKEIEVDFNASIPKDDDADDEVNDEDDDADDEAEKLNSFIDDRSESELTVYSVLEKNQSGKKN